MKNDKEILKQALSSLEGVNIDIYNSYISQKKERYNFEAIGKVMIIKRMLAEMLNEDLNQYLLPGESCAQDDDDLHDLQRFFSCTSIESLNSKEKDFLKETVLPMLSNISGINDSDDACLRCTKRMLAELCDYEPLADYRLMMEKEIKRIYKKV